MHNNVAYSNLQPTGPGFVVNLATPPGSWGAINSQHATRAYRPVPVFLLRTCHGNAPVDASYAYAVGNGRGVLCTVLFSMKSYVRVLTLCHLCSDLQ